MPAPSATAKGRGMGPWALILPDRGQSFAGKTPVDGVLVSYTIGQEDLRLVRPRALRAIWWLLFVGVLWL